PSAVILHSPVPAQYVHEYFRNATGELTVGVWETTGYHRKLIDFPRQELMHLLEGSVTFTDDRGATQTFHAGDTYFVPLGTPNSWKSEGTLRKIYCIIEPPKT
ncbi:MAG TPA: cupin domain-containing protein, partial [Aestuariivirga sp.]|nr:cupin domain-containing protein [Aestuariivirga sp.]